MPQTGGTLETGDRPASLLAGDGNTLNRPMTRFQSAAGLLLAGSHTPNREGVPVKRGGTSRIMARRNRGKPKNRWTQAKQEARRALARKARELDQYGRHRRLLTIRGSTDHDPAS